MLSDHDRSQLAGRWARRYPAAMLRSPYLRPDELAAARRRVQHAERNRGHRPRRAPARCPAVAQPRIRLIPVTRDQAMAFVAAVHRHHGRPQGYRFAVGAHDGNRLVGVAVAGHPVARGLADGWTLEVRRIASDGTPNVCSALYGACWRAARALGYTRAVTYTQQGESGASLRAAGWTLAAELPSRAGWNTASRPRADRGADRVRRFRWEIAAAGHGCQPRIAVTAEPGPAAETGTSRPPARHRPQEIDLSEADASRGHRTRDAGAARAERPQPSP